MPVCSFKNTVGYNFKFVFLKMTKNMIQVFENKVTNIQKNWDKANLTKPQESFGDKHVSLHTYTSMYKIIDWDLGKKEFFINEHVLQPTLLYEIF